MINVENMRRFIKALRSRKYKQVQSQLYGSDNLSCALGVAGRELLWADKNNYRAYRDIRLVLGIDADLQDEIIRLNDSENKKFYQIARFLERKFRRELTQQS